MSRKSLPRAGTGVDTGFPIRTCATQSVGATMADFLGLMKQAAELKCKMEAMQAERDSVEVEGVAGGGRVKVTLTGQGEMKPEHLDESLFEPAGSDIIRHRIA